MRDKIFIPLQIYLVRVELHVVIVPLKREIVHIEIGLLLREKNQKKSYELFSSQASWLNQFG